MTRLTALFIGNESLTQQCAAAWLGRGHAIAAVVTRQPEFAAWASGQGLRVEAPGKDLAARLAGLSVDWLLSVANLSLVAPEVLALARQGGVNFHDGPLPERAGLNAPVWALLEGAPRHGITWHLITAGVDEGDILESRRFDIAPGETALTLNTRCYEAAMDSFPAVIDQLEQGLRRQPQDLSGRRIHARADRPAAFGRFVFARPAAEVARQVRALDHGRYWNPLTTAKIATASGVLNVGTAEEAEGAGAPGQVLSASPEGLVVASGQGAVRLNRLTCQHKGLPVCPSTIKDTHLAAPTDPAALAAALAAVVPAEARLRKALATMTPAQIGGVPTEAAAWEFMPVETGVSGAASAQALALSLARLGGQAQPTVALAHGRGLAGYVADWAPVVLDLAASVAENRARLGADAAGWALDLMTRDAALSGLTVPPVALSLTGAPLTGSAVTAVEGGLYIDLSRLDRAEAEAPARRLSPPAQATLVDEAAPLSSLPALAPDEVEAALPAHNQTLAPRLPLCVHQSFEAQVARTPDAPAVSFEATTLSYAELNARANRAAHVLIGMGVRPGTLVGLHTRRSLDMLVGALAIQKAGGAYVPMDPAYPADRTALYAEDSGCTVIVTQRALEGGLPAGVQTLCLDNDGRLADAPATNPDSGVTPADLAYVIYTSGSTGRPKGVMVEHRNVQNFFTGMDQRLGTEAGVWLAVTSISFDISVLELFWTLARGFKLVISSDENRALVSSGRITSARKMDFSIYYWGNDDGAGPKKYELLIEGAKFADNHGFVAVWTPERHFHAFGGPYPNPSVTGAAVAAVTKNIGVRAGSCVVPLHHPARIAEEWAVIDNLTNGRAGIAIASGWQPEDFVLRPENTPPKNKAAMYAAADQVRRLWRGEGVDFPKADGTPFTVRTQPRPVSAELPLWVTTAGNPETWREAGEMGANVLTHLLGQSVDEVAGKIAIYREARAKAGHDPEAGAVTPVLHTHVGPDREKGRPGGAGP